MAESLETECMHSLRQHVLAGIVTICVLVFGIGGWAVLTEFSGAVISNGQLVVRSEVKKVQHPVGGVVSEVLVKEGDVVKAGQLLVKLDDAMATANLSIINAGLDEARARQARNLAERDGADTISFPPELLNRADQPGVQNLITGERRLFESRREARVSQKARLAEQVTQFRQQILGLEQQIAAKSEEIVLIQRELRGVRDLFARQLVPIQRLSQLERENARLSGERGQFLAGVSVVRARIAETELQIIQIDQELRNEAGKELAELRGRIAELVERRFAAEDLLRKVEIRSPQNGTITLLSVHAAGAVVNPNSSDPIMLVVPIGDDLLVESKIAPSEIDQIYVGQKAIVKFPSFNQRTTPEILGQVALISADARKDPRTGASYYTVRLELPPDQTARLGGLTLIPGMPTEAFIQTQMRTVASFLLRPLAESMNRTFREK